MKTHELLKKYFEQRKKSSPGFSLRSLARRLEISPSFLSRALNGQRALPEELQRRLAEALNVEPEILAGRRRRTRDKAQEAGASVSEWKIAANDSQQILRAWYFIPILEVTTLPEFDGTRAQIGARLGLTPYATEIAVNELLRLRLLEEVQGRLRKTAEKIRITSSRPNPLIRKFHDEMLIRCQHHLRTALSESDLKNRLITGITVTANADRVQDAKRKLHDFLYELANELLAEEGTEVYHLSAQLFPLTQDPKISGSKT